MELPSFILTSFASLAIFFLILAIINIALDWVFEQIKKYFKNPKTLIYLGIILLILIVIFIINYSIKYFNLNENDFCEGSSLKSNSYFFIIKILIQKDYQSFLKYLGDLSLFLFSIIVPILFGLLATKKLVVRLIINFIGISFLLAILMPGFVPNETRAKISSVKANMHSFQTMLETYAVDNNGFYPKDTKELELNAKKNNYWKELKNPYKNDKTNLDLNNSISALEKTLKCISFFDTYDIPAGVVLYNPIFDNHKKITKYYLYGTAFYDNERIIIKDQSKLFYLSNE